MSNTATLEQSLEHFLFLATGLPREQILALYNAGHPWPLWVSHDIRKAGLMAQAKGLLFPDALVEVQEAADGYMNRVLAALEADDRAKGSVSMAERSQAFISFPWFREILDHIDRILAHTTASRSVVVLFSFAIQRYAILHPGWELVGALLHPPPECMC